MGKFTGVNLWSPTLIKRVSILLFSTYIGPFAVTFIVAMFLFEMQFVWLYLDELMGKGLEASVIGKLLTYVSARLVNMALPLAVLMSSIMALGTLSENNELTALKSSGVSLMRILRPLLVFSVILSLVAFLFANNVWPIANLKFRALLKSIGDQRPTLTLSDGVFYNGIKGYSIRVGRNDVEKKELHDVLIYDHSNRATASRKVIRAKMGRMEQTSDKQYLVLTLSDGLYYDEPPEKISPKKEPRLPLIKGQFDQMVLRLDLSSLMFSNDNESIMKSSYEMMTIGQLNTAIDSLAVRLDSVITDLSDATLEVRLPAARSVADTTTAQSIPDSLASGEDRSLLDHWNARKQERIVELARMKNRKKLDALDTRSTEITHLEKSLARHQIEWHRKFFLAVACLVLFFIGSSLGAIIRKGGIGLPTLIAIVLFILFQLLTMAGEKMAKSGLVAPVIGMWLSTAVFLPLSIYLTRKATKDSVIFNLESYLSPFYRMAHWFRKTILRRAPQTGTKGI
ncbi:MAG: LptF/LptG family permease [Flavobacteriales bacterium]|nr:LptF/LptG family permease [Flavobacteriales bacterium]